VWWGEREKNRITELEERERARRTTRITKKVRPGETM
jgi:hypothetical protein